MELIVCFGETGSLSEEWLKGELRLKASPHFSIYSDKYFTIDNHQSFNLFNWFLWFQLSLSLPNKQMINSCSTCLNTRKIACEILKRSHQVEFSKLLFQFLCRPSCSYSLFRHEKHGLKEGNFHPFPC